MTSTNEDIISSLYPPPPPYFKYFTEENLNNLEIWKNKAQDEMQIDKTDLEQVKEDQDIKAPGQLKFLVPPKQPDGDHYRGFGNLWSFEDKLPGLKELGWTQLYKDDDELITSNTKIAELHKLMDSLLLNFLELIGVVSIDPQQFHYKIEDLKLILININHILNTYRPHQSRESLIMLLRKQIDMKRNEISEIDKTSEDIKLRILKLVDTSYISDQEDVKSEHDSTEDGESIKNNIIQKLLNQNV